ncbi:MAG: tetratricopeptide repeat protein, partial [Planctomycetes bacterium]|nr:tetratricopeptide repeat protein [Planctomycetota bacterium]
MPRQVNSKLILRTAGTLLLIVAVVLVMGRLLHRKALSEVLPRARKLAEEEEYSKAAELYELHLEKHDDDKDALEEYANVLMKTARGRLAADQYRKIVSLDPKDYDARLWLAQFTIVNAAGLSARGKTLESEAKWAEAAALGSKMIQLDTDRPEGYRCLAQAQASLEKFEEADKTLQELIAKHPDEEMAYFQRAEIARRQERPVQEWRRHIEECLEKNPKSWSAHLQAYIYIQLHGVAGAEEYLKRALELGPDEPTVLANAGLGEERLAGKARQEK